ncbi:hypothetical protein BDV24DRAFT_43140 [Aspergillus arachidicola]|uniref:Uncharacterized protein n=1 Tax=Aspergillus arachidicola TaxID=656916 RepID=A0A5N6YCP5_9EURO|nr:hypothetical protein BDV24DRAFT_43140 [Aspergillus arachidicola]
MSFRFLAFLTIRAQRCTRFAFAPIYHTLQRAAFTISVIWQSRLFLRIISCDCSPVNRRSKRGYEDLIWYLFLLALVLFCFSFSLSFREDNIWMAWYSYVDRPGARTYVRATTIMRSISLHL